MKNIKQTKGSTQNKGQSQKLSIPEKGKPEKSGIILKPANKLLYPLLLGVVLVLTVILYSGSLSGKILNWDDNTYILENSAIHKLDFQHVKEIFTGFYALNYHPLTSLSWALEYSAVGDSSTFLYHFDNLLLHLLNIILVFWLFRLITKKNSVALIVALLHALHPAHVESVAWIAERKDVLYSLFFLLSAVMYIFYLQKGNILNANQGNAAATPKRTWKYYLFSLTFFILSLLSKPSAVILPLSLLLFDYLLLRKLSFRLFTEKIPFFALSLLFGIIAIRSQDKAINDIMHYSLFQDFLIINTTFWKYLLMTVFPAGLSAFYPWPKLTAGALPFIYYASPLFTALIIGVAWYSVRKSRELVFGLLFFLFNLLLVLQLLPVGEAVMADRYTYIPFIGIFYLFAIWIARLFENRNKRIATVRLVSLFVLALFCTGFSYTLEKRIKVWHSDTDLWNDMISNYPETAYKAYLNRARYRHDNNDAKGAYDDLTILIKAGKYYSEALAMRGLIISDSGDYPNAMKDFNEAVKNDPGYFLAYNNRGATEMKLNDFKAAMTDFNKSISLKQDYYLSWYNRGVAYINLKKFPDAVNDFVQSVKLKPDYCPSLFGKGAAYAGSGMIKEAIMSYSEAISCNPKYDDAYVNRGSSKMNENDYSGALADFNKAKEINPRSYHAYFNIAKIEMNKKDFKTALQDLSRCIALNPSFPGVWAALGTCSYNLGDKTAACEQWAKGIQTGDQEAYNFSRLYCR